VGINWVAERSPFLFLFTKIPLNDLIKLFIVSP
jgi:hypothetical protein